MRTLVTVCTGLFLLLSAGCAALSKADGSLTDRAMDRAFAAPQGPAPFEAESPFGEGTTPPSSSPSHLEGVEALFPRLAWPEGGIFGRKEPVDLDLRGADLAGALKMMADPGGVPLLFQGAFSTPVDAEFHRVTLDEAFRALLEQYRCGLERKGTNWLVSRRDPRAPVQHVFRMHAAPAGKVKDGLVSVLGEGVTPVVGPEGNTLVVTASLEALERAAAYLDAVDRPERQVVIETRIVEVLLSDLLELGTEMNFQNIHVDETTSQILSTFLPAFGAGTSHATVTFTGDKAAIDGSFQVLKRLTRMEVLSRPKVVAASGEEAKIEITEEIPYVQATTTTTGTSDGVGTATVEEVEFKEVGIKLQVVPVIRGDDAVELKIKQEASEEKMKFMDVPVVDKRIVDTKLLVQNGQTVILGGLIKTVTRREVSGIPFIMDIPLLGNLFKHRKDVKEKRELMILITPEVSVFSEADKG